MEERTLPMAATSRTESWDDRDGLDNPAWRRGREGWEREGEREGVRKKQRVRDKLTPTKEVIHNVRTSVFASKHTNHYKYYHFYSKTFIPMFLQLCNVAGNNTRRLSWNHMHQSHTLLRGHNSKCMDLACRNYLHNDRGQLVGTLCTDVAEGQGSTGCQTGTSETIQNDREHCLEQVRMRPEPHRQTSCTHRKYAHTSCGTFTTYNIDHFNSGI